MIKSNKLTFGGVIIIVILLIVGNWAVPVQANNENFITPTPTGTPLTSSSGQGEPVSAEQQEEIKTVIQAYFEIRYRALSVSQPHGFRPSGFGALVSDGEDTKPFLNAELGKLALEIKYAELNHSRYVYYNYFLDFGNFSMDTVTQSVTASVIENNEFISENSARGNPAHPLIAQTKGLKHTFVLRKELGEWKIVSDSYSDFLWRTLRRKGKSAEDMLKMLNAMKISPVETPSEYTRTVTDSLLPYDPSSDTYDANERSNAAYYAVNHAWPEDYNHDYPSYDDGEHGDCTNFVSQALYEGGNVTMYIPDPPIPGIERSGWYILNDLERATDWNDVDRFYEFVVTPDDREWATEGPEGYELGPVSEGQVPAGLMVGDVIQYNEEDDAYWEHSAIVVGFDLNNGDPLVASHSPNTPTINFRDVVVHIKTRFIHIERSDGYPPIKAETMLVADDAGGNPMDPCPNTNPDFGNNYFGGCANGGNITSGFLFRNIQIPPGAQIKYAYVTFTTDMYSLTPYDGDGNPNPFYQPISILIYGENTGTPESFTSTNTPADRTNLTIGVSWPIDGSINGVAYDTWPWPGKRTTPSIKDIIQDIIESGWAYGNTISLIFKNEIPGDTHHRRVVALENLPQNYSPARLVAAYDLGTPVPLPPIQKSVPLYSFGTKDGWILESSETSGKGGSISADDMTIYVGDDAANKQYRSILHFDTSTLPDNAVITTVELKIKQWSIFGTNPFTTHGNLILDIKKPSFGNANLAKSDFEASATPGGYAGAGIFNPVPSGDWYTVTLNSAALSYINLIGTTQFRLAFTLDDNNDLDPDFILFYSGDILTPTNRPQLIIYYYIPPL